MIQERNVATCLILSLVTCGIYGLVWLYNVATDVQGLGADDVNPAMDLLLAIVCFPYWWYLMFKYPQRLYELGRDRNPAIQDQSTVSILLAVLATPLVSLLIIQSELNKLANT